jgi:peroxiredoxin
MALKVGEVAPDFSVAAVRGTEKFRISLGEYRGEKNVVLVFYVLNWTPV